MVNNNNLAQTEPFICNKALPVIICWQFKITGLKLKS